jgi:hypothetical protein
VKEELGKLFLSFPVLDLIIQQGSELIDLKMLVLLYYSSSTSLWSGGAY